MRPSHFRILTGINRDKHDYLRRHGWLPFLDSAAREGWADYSHRQVLLTAVAVELAPLVGGPVEAARRVAEFPSSELSRIWGTLWRPALGDVWALNFTVDCPTDNPRIDVERIEWRFSPVGQQDASIEMPAALIGSDAATLPLVNLSAIMRSIRARAAAAGIRFHEDAANA